MPGEERKPKGSAGGRHYRTFRLRPGERELLRNLGRGRTEIPNRYTALLELVGIVRRMAISKKEDRQALRIGIPEELRAAIDERVGKTGHTFQDILLMAAEIYRERYPLSETVPSGKQGRR